MSKEIKAMLVISHLLMGLVGFVIGVYSLPILIAPPAPTAAEVAEKSIQAQYSAQFIKDLAGSDRFHWGQGEVSISNTFITLQGEIAPGPDYKLYLSPAFVETEAEFEQLKASMVQVGEVNTFENFVVPVSPSIDVSQFNTVVIWCESFAEFITAAQYR